MSQDIFKIHYNVMKDYRDYITSFINISDNRIRQEVDKQLEGQKLWPEPLIQFNPAFEYGESIDDLCSRGVLHEDIKNIFQGYKLYKHQVDAIRLGSSEKDFIVTSGTGSGKSLTYLGTIFNHLLRNHSSGQGIQAIIIYPMNALINSQTEEIKKYQSKYESSFQKSFPISFQQYTGQEKREIREQIRKNPPDILLTNYMMMELLLTRIQERSIRDSLYANLKYLVFDELHTYRGRQGADVSMLIRRIKARATNNVQCIGTSATMISGGSILEQKVEVAKVASKIFGIQFESDQVVDEYLRTSLSDFHKNLNREDLIRAVQTGIGPNQTEGQLVVNPLAIWLEREIALKQKESRLIRNEPLPLSEIKRQLVTATNLDESTCSKVLLNLLQWIADINIQKGDSRDTYLPYKLHQFLSQTGAVYTTLEQPESRTIEIDPEVVIIEKDGNKLPLFPMVFSRITGQEFICVTKNEDKKRLEPRDFFESADEDEASQDGYLILDLTIWNPNEDLNMLPEAWIKSDKTGNIIPEKKYKERLPSQIYFNANGDYTDQASFEHPYEAWYMPSPLLFDPTSGMIYDPRTRENTKLARLGSEGRSTSTTVLSLSILKQMAENGFESKDQKVLSFTDNRQDAALQSGHFNDFYQTIQLRSAIFHALSKDESHELEISNLSQFIFDALNLPFLEYANMTEMPRFPTARRDYEEAFKDYLMYRALYDLRWGWRVILPNLEQCALLLIDYKDLEENSYYDQAWEDVPILKDMSGDERRNLLFQLFEYFRKAYALYSENYLTESAIRSKRIQINEKLKQPWKFGHTEKVSEPYFLRLRPLRRGQRIYSKSIGYRSGIGKYIRELISSHQENLNEKGYLEFMEELLPTLEPWLFISTAMNQDGQDEKVYQLRVSEVIWKLSDGQTVLHDPVKQRAYRDIELKPNLFFQNLYQTNFRTYKSFDAKEHTAQITDPEVRKNREADFREGKISCLYCSPTMELGIDIASLNVVHMRNVPPNPANYAQRGGRAGRSGQAALVFTFCSTHSPHDRHYFKNAVKMVAGAVTAPRIDINNEELLLSHLNALYLSEIGLSGLDESIYSVLEDLTDGSLPLRKDVIDHLQSDDDAKQFIAKIFDRVMNEYAIEVRVANYFNQEWIVRNLDQLVNHFDEALNRWRTLYRAMQVQLHEAQNIIKSGIYAANSPEMKQAKQNQSYAIRQRQLLKNESSFTGKEISEFYPYRYLASEGFLPGYNFTRLPIRTFVQRGDSGEYISRPRFMALKEFGPGNVLYHSGAKFMIHQLVLPEAESELHQAKVSIESGYFLDGQEYNKNNCPFTGQSLIDSSTKKTYNNLIQMSETRAKEEDRITCEEEERVSKGFHITTYFSMPGGMETERLAYVKSGEDILLRIHFLPAARLIQVNERWRISKDDGFLMGMSTGFFKRKVENEEIESREENRVIQLYTTDTADALYIEPMESLALDSEGVITLQYAMKHAIESIFQIEPRELAACSMGDGEHPNIFIYEATEGSLGVLSQFVEDIRVFPEVIKEAFRICRFDDEFYKAPASYEDLLSYYNQRFHRIIDRFKIKGALEKMMACEYEIVTQKQHVDYETQYEHLQKQRDHNSQTEDEFLKYLYAHKLRLPDKAQERLDGIYSQPDFFYEPNIWIFCDGTPHDQPEIKEQDKKARAAIRARGDDIVVYYYKEKLAEVIAKRPDIFKKVQ